MKKLLILAMIPIVMLIAVPASAIVDAEERAVVDRFEGPLRTAGRLGHGSLAGPELRIVTQEGPAGSKVFVQIYCANGLYGEGHFLNLFEAFAAAIAYWRFRQ